MVGVDGGTSGLVGLHIRPTIHATGATPSGDHRRETTQRSPPDRGTTTTSDATTGTIDHGDELDRLTTEQLPGTDARLAAREPAGRIGAKRSSRRRRSARRVARGTRRRRLARAVRRGGLRHADVARGVRRRAVASPPQARQLDEFVDRYRVPRPWNILGIGMGGPTVIDWGTEEQKHRYVRGIATNQDIWCQLFSEPGAGSDVAGLSTSAVRDGDEWVVNGQKVWTTMGHVAKLRHARRAHRSRPTEAPRPQLLRARHARTGRGGAPARADHRGRRVQRGLLHRRADSRLARGSGPRAKAGASRSPRS